jgi:hypothetical protein
VTAKIFGYHVKAKLTLLVWILVLAVSLTCGFAVTVALLEADNGRTFEFVGVVEFGWGCRHGC